MKTASVTQRIPVPHGVPLGALIGCSGCVQKNISRSHNVYCRVDVDQRQVVLSGLDHLVKRAKNSVYRIIKAEQEKQDAPSLTDDLVAAMATTVISLHQNERQWAAVKDGEKYVWYLQKSREIEGDAMLVHHPYRLRRLSNDMAVSLTNASSTTNYSATWVDQFDGEYIAKMKAQVATLSTDDVKLKAAIGMMYFCPRNERSRNVLQWSKLQTLIIPRELGMRWSNLVTADSPSVASFLDFIDTQTNGDNSFKPVLSVFVKRSGNPNAPDVIVKFHKDYGVWTMRRAPRFRKVHWMHSVLLDEETAFRIRVCSWKSFETPPESIADQYILIDQSGDESKDFGIENVRLAKDAPSDWSVVEWSVTMKTHAYMNDLRFTVKRLTVAGKTMNAVECRLGKSLTTHNKSQDIETLTHKMCDLLKN